MILNKTGSYLYATVGLLAAPWKLPNLERGGQSIIMQQHLFAPGPTHNFRFSPLPYKEFEVPFCPKTERVRERDRERGGRKLAVPIKVRWQSKIARRLFCPVQKSPIVTLPFLWTENFQLC